LAGKLTDTVETIEGVTSEALQWMSNRKTVPVVA
nr:hypothetical protein [Tanacetum cinerariifolium]GEZ94217.1 hypothetical protein [Tanacetum cinerariifolium]